MAHKTDKELKEKISTDAWYRLQIVARNPKYQEDYNQYLNKYAEIMAKYKKDRNNVIRTQEYEKLVNWLKEKYNIPILWIPGVTSKEFIPAFASFFVAQPLVKGRLSNERYLDVRIDTYQDLESIKRGVGKIIESVKKLREETENNAKSKQIANEFVRYVKKKKIKCGDEEMLERFVAYKEKRLKRIPKIAIKRHLSKTDRYIKVFDMRNRRPPVPYKKMVKSLQQEGYYEGMLPNKVIDSVRQDFSLIFEEIYGIPYRKYDGKDFRKANPLRCITCEKRAQCKAQHMPKRKNKPIKVYQYKNEVLCADAEYDLRHN